MLTKKRKKRKVATVGNSLDVGSEKDSSETKITLGFPVGRSMIGWYFPLQWKTGQIEKMSSFCHVISFGNATSVGFKISCG